MLNCDQNIHQIKIFLDIDHLKSIALLSYADLQMLPYFIIYCGKLYSLISPPISSAKSLNIGNLSSSQWWI